MISYLSQVTNPIDLDIFKVHKDNILVKDLVYQFFEEKTINSLYDPNVENLYITPVDLISDYVRNCCRAIYDITDHSYFTANDLEDILPSDKILQDYMSYLVKGHMTNKQPIIKEFKEYEMKLEAKMDDPDLMYLLEAIGKYSKLYSGKEHRDYFYNPYNRDQTIENLEIKAPFPIFYLFDNTAKYLPQTLSMNVCTLALQMILYIGETCDAEDWVNPKTGKWVSNYIDKKTGEVIYDDSHPLSPEDIPAMNTGGNDDAIQPIVQDEKFKKLVDSIQGEYRIGLEVFKKGKLTGMKKSV